MFTQNPLHTALAQPVRGGKRARPNPPRGAFFRRRLRREVLTHHDLFVVAKQRGVREGDAREGSVHATCTRAGEVTETGASDVCEVPWEVEVVKL